MGKEKEVQALEVIVEQKPGVINWNFEQLKTALAEKMKEYEGLVYTEETVPVAKKDIATLRQLKKSVSDKRIEIKKKCLEPYAVIEKQAEELTKLLDTPINQIAKQLEDYEKQRKAEARKQIVAYMDEKFANLPEDISNKLKTVIYDERWENASTAKKVWKQSIDEAHGRTQGDLAVIGDIEEEFKPKVMKVYSVNLVLSEAVAKATELRNQKLEILARERERIAEEERRKAQEEMRKAKEALTGVQRGDNEQSGVNVPPIEKNAPVESLGGSESVIGDSGPVNIDQWLGDYEDPKPKTEKTDNTRFYELRIRATQEQIFKIRGYIEYTGAVYTEREV